jgi:hypothetical protein
MPARVLVRDRKYAGLYVALKSFSDTTVVASGRTPLSAQRKARAAGAKDPVIVFVPRENRVHIY